MALLYAVSLPFLVVVCLTLGLAPFVPEPHLVEKLRMLAQGQLVRPVDIFDLFLRGTPFVILGLKLIRMATAGQG